MVTGSLFVFIEFHSPVLQEEICLVNGEYLLPVLRHPSRCVILHFSELETLEENWTFLEANLLRKKWDWEWTRGLNGEVAAVRRHRCPPLQCCCTVHPSAVYAKKGTILLVPILESGKVWAVLHRPVRRSTLTIHWTIVRTMAIHHWITRGYKFVCASKFLCYCPLNCLLPVSMFGLICGYLLHMKKSSCVRTMEETSQLNAAAAVVGVFIIRFRLENYSWAHTLTPTHDIPRSYISMMTWIVHVFSLHTHLCLNIPMLMTGSDRQLYQW